MKILYAIQGTGNGHLSRARDIIPILQNKGDVDILVSGIQADVDLPYIITYKFQGLSFIFGKKGGVDLFETYKKSKVRKLFKEINSLPVEKYDLVINDFEPVSAWACYLKNKECIGLSHQAAVLNAKSPQPKHIDVLGRSILKNYAPTTAHYGFHFKQYGKNIFTPVIRKQVRELRPANKGYYTVYLPAYNDERIIKILSVFPNTKWEIFSKHNKKEIQLENISVYPVSNDAFIQSMANAEGVLCGAGFETPAEALFLKKKLMVIPMKNQYEQHCNAAALKEIGIPVIKSLKEKHLDKIKKWIDSDIEVPVNYPDITESIIDMILEKHAAPGAIILGKKIYSEKKFRKIALKKIITQLGA
ncbi:MAG: glycosyl transferase [Parafilimonas sp.]|nr:glycosyl transferase [Parafilimonas sp.]